MKGQENYYIFYCTRHAEYHYVLSEDKSLLKNCRRAPNTGYYWQIPKEIAEKIINGTYEIEGEIETYDPFADYDSYDDVSYICTIHYRPKIREIYATVRFYGDKPYLGKKYNHNNEIKIENKYKQKISDEIYDIEYVNDVDLIFLQFFTFTPDVQLPESLEELSEFEEIIREEITEVIVEIEKSHN